MLGFFLKKSFFDGWDHLLGLVGVNAGFLACALLAFASALAGNALLAALVLSLSWLAFSLWYGVACLATMAWADFGDFRLRDLPGALRRALVPSLQYGLLAGLTGLGLGYGLPFYLGQGIPGALAAGILLWTGLALLLALQYLLPLRFRLGGGFAKNLRKSFVLVLDNPGFSLLLLALGFLLLVPSLFLAFLLPGFGGVALLQAVGLRLRLRKYDNLEAHGTEAGHGAKPPIPWKELLAEDRELLGTRTLRGMIFPWKE